MPRCSKKKPFPEAAKYPTMRNCPLSFALLEAAYRRCCRGYVEPEVIYMSESMDRRVRQLLQAPVLNVFHRARIIALPDNLWLSNLIRFANHLHPQREYQLELYIRDAEES